MITKANNEVKSAKFTSSTISIVALIIAIAAIVFSLYQFQSLKNLRMTKQAVDESLQQLKQTDATLSVELNNELESLRKVTRVLMQKEKTLGMTNPNYTWTIANVEHLVRLASEQLITAQDVQTAQRLLSLADSAIESLQDPNLLPLREAINKDRQQLAAIKLPDLEGLWVRVGKLVEQVPTLPLQGLRSKSSPINTESKTEENREEAATEQTSEEKKEDSREESASEQSASWHQNLTNSLNNMNNLIKIRRHNKPIEPILSSEEQLLAKENLKLMLEQIRFSILDKNTMIYHQMITEAQKWINDYFELNDSEVQNFMSELKQLAEVKDLKISLPNLDATLQRVKAAQTQEKNPVDQGMNPNPTPTTGL